MAMEHRHGKLRRGLLRRFAALVLTLAVLCSALPTGVFAAAADENTQGDGARTETAADGGFAGLQNDMPAEETGDGFEAEVKAAEPDKAEKPDTEPEEGTRSAHEAEAEAAVPEAPDMAEPETEKTDPEKADVMEPETEEAESETPDMTEPETEEAESETADIAEPEMEAAEPKEMETPDAETEDEAGAAPKAAETAEPERDANAAAPEPGAWAEPQALQMEESGPADEADPADEPANPDGTEQPDAEQTEDEAEPEPYADAGDVAQVKTAGGTTSHAALEEAWAAAKAAGTATVTLLADVEISNPLYVDTGEDITFNGMDHTLTYNTAHSGKDFYVMGGILTISGGTVRATGEQNFGVEVVNGGIVNISGGTVEVMRDQGVGVLVRCGTVNITSGTVTATRIGVEFVDDGGTINISGGTVMAEGKGVMSTVPIDVTISGGLVTGGEDGVYIYPNSSTFDINVNITGGTVAATGPSGNGLLAAASTVNITGGTFTATGQQGTGIHLNGSEADIVGGTVMAMAPEGTGIYAESSTMTLSNGTIEANSIGVQVDWDGTTDISGGVITAAETGVKIDLGEVNISGGSITTTKPSANGGGVVYEYGTLAISGGTITAADTGVRVNGNVNGVSLSGGTFTGADAAVSVRNGKVSGTLENFGAPDDPHYAFVGTDGKPFAVEADALGMKTLPGGTFTVEECGHDTTRRYSPLSDGKHRLNCAACGYEVGQEDCPFDVGESQDENNHILTCTQCGNTKEDAHSITLAASVSGTVITLQRACAACGYTSSGDFGTVTLGIPALVYGETLEGKAITWETDVAQVDALRFSPIDTPADVPAEAFLCGKGESCPLTALAVNDPRLAAGVHTLYVEVETTDAAGVRETAGCAVPFTVDPAALTDGMVALSKTETVYNGTVQKPAATAGGLAENTDYTVTYSGGFTNAGTYTVTVSGIGNYAGDVQKTYTITPAVPVLTWGGAQTLTYTGKEAAIAPPEVTLVNGETFTGTIVYSHRKAGADAWTDGLPVDAGTYTVKAVIAAQGNYAAAEATTALTIQKSENAPQVPSGTEDEGPANEDPPKEDPSNESPSNEEPVNEAPATVNETRPVKENPQTGQLGGLGEPEAPRRSTAAYTLVILMGAGAFFAARRKKKENDL